MISLTLSVHLYVLKDFLLLSLLFFYHSLFPLIFFSVCSFPSLFATPSLLVTGSFLWQQWDKGGGSPEEPEWFIADTRLASGPQPPVLPAPVGPEPQPAVGLDVPQCGRLPGETALQLSCERIQGSFLLCSSAGPRRHLSANLSIEDKLSPRHRIANILFRKLLLFHPQPLYLVKNLTKYHKSKMYLLSIEYLSRTGVTLFLNMTSLFGGNLTPSTDPVQLIDKSRPLLNNRRSVGGRNRALGFRKYQVLPAALQQLPSLS